MSFAGDLRLLRRQRFLARTELRELAEAQHTHISRLESGFSKAPAGTLRPRADAPGVKADFLMQGAADEAPEVRFEDRELAQQAQGIQPFPANSEVLVKSFLAGLHFQRRIHRIAMWRGSRQ